MKMDFPQPDAQALALGNKLLERIIEQIHRQGGVMPFDHYMEMALYTPGLGYYANGLLPFGDLGDFITAPESGDLFARSLATPVAEVFSSPGQGQVLELGAGSAALAIGLVKELELRDSLPGSYLIFERSDTMKAQQRANIEAALPHLMDRFRWLDRLPESPVSGVIFANEVADALPVKRFRWQQGQVIELGVGVENNALVETPLPADAELTGFAQQLATGQQWDDGYQSEWCPGLKPWIRDLAACLDRGLLFLLDYGYPRQEYYHPQRTMGTLITHFRHRVSDDPFSYPGLQDITAFVDFTAIAEAGVEAGLRLRGFTSQANFLLGCGIDRLLGQIDPADTRQFLQASNELKRLVLPTEMGERFKSIGFSRALDIDISGFGSHDLRSRL